MFMLGGGENPGLGIRGNGRTIARIFGPKPDWYGGRACGYITGSPPSSVQPQGGCQHRISELKSLKVTPPFVPHPAYVPWRGWLG